MSQEFTDFMNSTNPMTFTNHELALIRIALYDRTREFDGQPPDEYAELADRITNELQFEG